MPHIKKLIFTAVCVTMGIVLPMTLHAVPNGGGIFLLMHIPVLLCGLACGWPYGLACGALTPLLCSLLTGMPPPAILPSMLCELAVYGAVTGLCMRFMPVKNAYTKVYIALLAAMLTGRAVFGLVNAFIFFAGNYSMKIWLGAAFVTALPGILIQIVLIPPLVFILRRAKLITLP
ncbi:MAG: ECF transporter S component [Clostridiales bacterium]|nr:ECF transporter S component [Clostridiales bacterium]